MGALQELLDAVATLSNEQRVLELAVQAIADACGRGVAFGVTSRGPRSERMGRTHILYEGKIVPVAPSHLAYVRTPAYDLAEVPVGQRNRWVEPFREGIATPEGLKKSTIYPIVARFGTLDMGRVAVCAGRRQVAFVGVSIPEGTTFSEDERTRLTETAAALVVPLRVAAILGEAAEERSSVQQMLDTRDDALLALGRNGEVEGASRRAFELLRRDRGLPERLRAAVRSLARDTAIVREGEQVIHVSRCCPGEVAFLAVVDGEGFAEPPVDLSPRQRELLEHVERGLTNAQVGAAMGIAPSTVKTMLERLYERAGVANRIELLGWWRGQAR